jgi:hypothetical protein
MFFQIAKHFFGPHSAPIIAQGHTQIGQVGGQAPGLFLADLPIHQQVDRVDLLGCQTNLAQPDTLTGLLDKAAKGSPTAFFIEPDPVSLFWRRT